MQPKFYRPYRPEAVKTLADYRRNCDTIISPHENEKTKKYTSVQKIHKNSHNTVRTEMSAEAETYPRFRKKQSGSSNKNKEIENRL